MWKKFALIEFAAAKVLFIIALIARIMGKFIIPVLPFGVRITTLLSVCMLCLVTGCACLLMGIYENTLEK